MVKKKKIMTLFDSKMIDMIFTELPTLISYLVVERGSSSLTFLGNFIVNGANALKKEIQI
jgi:hypothetical protein